MHSLPDLGSATLSQQHGARLLFRLVRGILIALATIACACFAGGMADGCSPAVFSPLAAPQAGGALDGDPVRYDDLAPGAHLSGSPVSSSPAI